MLEHFIEALPAIISGITVTGVALIAKWVHQIIRESKHDREVNEKALLWQLRSVIWSPYFSFEEKSIAFKEYHLRGGNSLTEAHFMHEKEEHIKSMSERTNND